MIRKIQHIGIAVRSLQEAIPFYRDVLGLSLVGTEEVADQKGRAAPRPPPAPPPPVHPHPPAGGELRVRPRGLGPRRVPAVPPDPRRFPVGQGHDPLFRVPAPVARTAVKEK